MECEEKRWRGQLKRPQTIAVGSQEAAIPAISSGAAAAPARALAAPESARSAPAGQANQPPAAPANTRLTGDLAESKAITSPAVKLSPVSAGPGKAAPQDTGNVSAPFVPAFTLSAGLEPQQSWLSSNKYVLGAILAAAGTVAAILLLR